MTVTRYTKEKFFSRMEPQPTGCIHWPTGTARYGYGQLSYQRRRVLAHRLAWELTHGPIPEGMDVLHACDNPRCCNVEHLSLGTHHDNMRDMMLKGRAAKKLTLEDVAIVVEAIQLGATHKEAGDLVGVGRRSAGRMMQGTRWGWVKHDRA